MSSESEDFDAPVQLPGGRLVCGSHGYVVCPFCCVDFSFMDDDEEIAVDSEDEVAADSDDEAATDSDDDVAGDSHGQSIDHSPIPLGASNPLHEPGVGTGRVIPTKFEPPNLDDTPQSLFPLGISVKYELPAFRFINHTDKSQVLIFTDGACLDNGSLNPQAGCAFVYKPGQPETDMPRHLRFDPHRYNEEKYPNYLRFRLEAEGPTGERYPQTSNRAELRAVIAALRFRFWFDEGFNKVVIATDSAYVVEGITKWIYSWLRNNWRTSLGGDVKNKDLWQLLLWEMERYDVRNTKIQFWRIPRELNSKADYHAKEGATEEPSIKFGDHRAVSHDWVQFYRVDPTSTKRKMPADFY